jgi:hypothetical protein
MAVRKICKRKRCRASPRCDHPWWFDVWHNGKRWRMRVDDFAARPAHLRASRFGALGWPASRSSRCNPS